MKFGFVGAGNMARSLALGLGEPAIFADSGSGRAAELAELTGGSTATPEEIAAACDVIFLAHKPAQLEQVAGSIAGYAGTVVSVLAATTLEQLRAAYSTANVLRTMPNIPVELGVGVFGVADESDAAPGLDPYFKRFGSVVRCPEEQFELFTAIGGCAPAFFARFAQGLIESAVARGMDRELAARTVNETMAGSAAVLRESGVDSEGLSARVASPGGLTERALQSLEANELRETIDQAVATVLGQ
jgi:pyrroline-5-carboxylate reductase